MVELLIALALTLAVLLLGFAPRRRVEAVVEDPWGAEARALLSLAPLPTGRLAGQPVHLIGRIAEVGGTLEAPFALPMGLCGWQLTAPGGREERGGVPFLFEFEGERLALAPGRLLLALEQRRGPRSEELSEWMATLGLPLREERRPPALELQQLTPGMRVHLVGRLEPGATLLAFDVERSDAQERPRLA